MGWELARRREETSFGSQKNWSLDTGCPFVSQTGGHPEVTPLRLEDRPLEPARRRSLLVHRGCLEAVALSPPEGCHGYGHEGVGS